MVRRLVFTEYRNTQRVQDKNNRYVVPMRSEYAIIIGMKLFFFMYSFRKSNQFCSRID